MGLEAMKERERILLQKQKEAYSPTAAVNRAYEAELAKAAPLRIQIAALDWLHKKTYASTPSTPEAQRNLAEHISRSEWYADGAYFTEGAKVQTVLNEQIFADKDPVSTVKNKWQVTRLALSPEEHYVAMTENLGFLLAAIDKATTVSDLKALGKYVFRVYSNTYLMYCEAQDDAKANEEKFQEALNAATDWAGLKKNKVLNRDFVSGSDQFTYLWSSIRTILTPGRSIYLTPNLQAG